MTVNDGMLVNVPKHSMVVISFGADGSNVEDVPMGYLEGYSSTGITIYDNVKIRIKPIMNQGRVH